MRSGRSVLARSDLAGEGARNAHFLVVSLGDQEEVSRSYREDIEKGDAVLRFKDLRPLSDRIVTEAGGTESGERKERRATYDVGVLHPRNDLTKSTPLLNGTTSPMP